MQSLEVINYMDAKEIAGILAMNGYLVTTVPVERESDTGYRKTKWQVAYTKETHKEENI